MLALRRACLAVGATASATYLFARSLQVSALCEQPNRIRKWNENWDFRQNKTSDDKPPVLPSKCRHIYLVRHGQYEQEADTDEKMVLTERGRQQAEFTGILLQQLGVKFEGVVSSTLTRAVQTADIICEHVSAPRNRCETISEGAPCPPDPPYPKWDVTPSEFFVESAMIEAGFRKFFYRASPEQKQDTNLLLVCHANVIRYMTCRALQLPPEAWLRFGLKHGSITKLTIFPDGNVTLSVFGETGHMPPNKVTQ